VSLAVLPGNGLGEDWEGVAPQGPGWCETGAVTGANFTPTVAALPDKQSAGAVPAALTEYRVRVRVRLIASRVAVVLAVLTLLATTAAHLWRPVLLVDQAWDPLASATRLSLLAAAIAMLVAARGLRRGHALAWVGTVGVLGISVLLHLAHRFDVVASLILLAGLVWLATQRRSFTVLPSRRDLRRSGWILLAGLGAVGLVVVGFGLLAGRAGDRHDDLIHARGVVRAVLTVIFLAVLAWSLTSPRRPRAMSATDHRAERERARRIVQRYGGGTLDYFALRDDKDWFFVGGTVVAHTVRGGVCLVSPDPIGPPQERAAAWAEFAGYAAEYGWSLAVLGAAAEWVPIYEATGLRALYLGDEAIVECAGFTLEGPGRKGLRQAVNRVVRAGCTTTFHDPAALDEDLRAGVIEVAGESRRGGAERGFSMTLSRMFDPADTGLLLAVTRNEAGRVEAFCQWTPAASVDGWSLDVMRRRTDADDVPNGIVEFTIVRTMQEVAARGGHGMGLNFAVMREVLEGVGDSRWRPLLRPVLRRLSENTQMSSLATFNAKFDPAWVPRYVALDSAEFVASQALVMAGAEGVTELPVIGRFLGAQAGPQ